MRNALHSKDIGAVIRAWRHHPAHGSHPIPQTELARWLDITQGHLSRIENGRNRVRDLDKLTHYALTLGVPRELLWFEIDDPEPLPRPAAHALQLRSGTVAGAAALQPTLANSLLTTLHEYVLTDKLTGPHPLLPIVAQQLQLIERLERTSRPRGRERLRTVRARFAEFLGWLHQDAGNLAAALAATKAAATLAHETGATQLLSYIRMRQSNLAADAGNPHAVIDLAQAALHSDVPNPPRHRAIALRQLAHGYARLGNATACVRALDQAQHYAAEHGDDDLAGYCTSEYIAMEAASCLVELGRPEQAIEILEPQLPRWQPDNRRDLGRALTVLARALARTRQPDDALKVAAHALAITTETRSTRTEFELYRLARELHTYEAPDHAAELRIHLHKALL
ncbi:helix-turn-helix domain-containing protein [Nocardia brasiliensis]|uniref:helix-turn-helix domain-containing protein n=1 Tax=Nocardia brasiliensis TaxID=37326 RepID=UPI002456D799|nr:helix-turn-helix transcriptional regulator [Nocardia brasiliensis]